MNEKEREAMYLAASAKIHPTKEPSGTYCTCGFCGSFYQGYAAATANNGGAMREALERVISAFTVEGRWPPYHRQQMALLKKNWNPLHTALTELVKQKGKALSAPTVEGKWIAVSEGLPTVEGFYWFRSRDDEIGTWKCWWSLADPQAPAWSKNQLAWWSVPIIEPKAPEYTPHGQEASE